MNESDKILATWEEQNKEIKQDIAEMKKSIGNKKIDLGSLLW